MSFDRIESYLSKPFTSETSHVDFYTYGNTKDLAVLCKINKEIMTKSRTIGILQSHHGKFFLSDIDASGIEDEYIIQISVAYLKSPPQSTLMPYPVQVFGTLQWKNRPVIFAKILQVLTVPIAIRIRNIMNTIAATHLATSPEDCLQDVPP